MASSEASLATGTMDLVASVVALECSLWAPSASLGDDSFAVMLRRVVPRVPVIHVFGHVELTHPVASSSSSTQPTAMPRCAGAAAATVARGAPQTASNQAIPPCAAAYSIAVHIHGAMPYFFVPAYDEDAGEATCIAFASQLERIAQSALRPPRAMPLIHHVALVRAIPFYGYHVSPRLFYKIFVYHPTWVSRIANLLGGTRSVGERRWQPYEAHVPFGFQFLMDMGLTGMGTLRVSQGYVRRGGELLAAAGMNSSQPEVCCWKQPPSGCEWSSPVTPCDIEIDVSVIHVRRPEGTDRPGASLRSLDGTLRRFMLSIGKPEDYCEQKLRQDRDQRGSVTVGVQLTRATSSSASPSEARGGHLGLALPPPPRRSGIGGGSGGVDSTPLAVSVMDVQRADNMNNIMRRYATDIHDHRERYMTSAAELKPEGIDSLPTGEGNKSEVVVFDRSEKTEGSKVGQSGIKEEALRRMENVVDKVVDNSHPPDEKHGDVKPPPCGPETSTTTPWQGGGGPPPPSRRSGANPWITIGAATAADDICVAATPKLNHQSRLLHDIPPCRLMLHEIMRFQASSPRRSPAAAVVATGGNAALGRFSDERPHRREATADDDDDVELGRLQTFQLLDCLGRETQSSVVPYVETCALPRVAGKEDTTVASPARMGSTETSVRDTPRYHTENEALVHDDRRDASEDELTGVAPGKGRGATAATTGHDDVTETPRHRRRGGYEGGQPTLSLSLRGPSEAEEEEADVTAEETTTTEVSDRQRQWVRRQARLQRAMTQVRLTLAAAGGSISGGEEASSCSSGESDVEGGRHCLATNDGDDDRGIEREDGDSDAVHGRVPALQAAAPSISDTAASARAGRGETKASDGQLAELGAPPPGTCCILASLPDELRHHVAAELQRVASSGSRSVHRRDDEHHGRSGVGGVVTTNRSPDGVQRIDPDETPLLPDDDDFTTATEGCTRVVLADGVPAAKSLATQVAITLTEEHDARKTSSASPLQATRVLFPNPSPLDVDEENVASAIVHGSPPCSSGSPRVVRWSQPRSDVSRPAAMPQGEGAGGSMATLRSTSSVCLLTPPTAVDAASIPPRPAHRAKRPRDVVVVPSTPPSAPIPSHPPPPPAEHLPPPLAPSPELVGDPSALQRIKDIDDAIAIVKRRLLLRGEDDRHRHQHPVPARPYRAGSSDHRRREGLAAIDDDDDAPDGGHRDNGRGGAVRGGGRDDHHPVVLAAEALRDQLRTLTQLRRVLTARSLPLLTDVTPAAAALAAASGRGAAAAGASVASDAAAKSAVRIGRLTVAAIELLADVGEGRLMSRPSLDPILAVAVSVTDAAADRRTMTIFVVCGEHKETPGRGPRVILRSAVTAMMRAAGWIGAVDDSDGVAGRHDLRGSRVQLAPNEGAMLDAVLSYLLAVNPDVIVCWDAARRGLGYLTDRYQRLHGRDLLALLSRLVNPSENERRSVLSAPLPASRFPTARRGGLSSNAGGAHLQAAIVDDNGDVGVVVSDAVAGDNAVELEEVQDDESGRVDGANVFGERQDMRGDAARSANLPNSRLGATASGGTNGGILRVTGRVIISLWKVVRSELKLRSYTISAVHKALFHQPLPDVSEPTLAQFLQGRSWAQVAPVTDPARPKSKDEDYGMRGCLEALHFLCQRTHAGVAICRKLDVFIRTAELAQIYGILFSEVLSRGSQFRVESVLHRFAKPLGYIMVSPSKEQVMLQNRQEGIPLVMEPMSAYYRDPVLVLDFRSLYPSIVVAYNLCYSTLLGKVSKAPKIKLGAIANCRNYLLYPQRDPTVDGACRSSKREEEDEEPNGPCDGWVDQNDVTLGHPRAVRRWTGSPPKGDLLHQSRSDTNKSERKSASSSGKEEIGEGKEEVGEESRASSRRLYGQRVRQRSNNPISSFPATTRDRTVPSSRDHGGGGPFDPATTVIAPNSAMFVAHERREGVLPILLQSILDMRLKVQVAMKEASQQGEGWDSSKRLFDAQQTGLKLLANVCYGYTAATFTGRMPCSDIADSIVLLARQTLERAIRTVEGNPRWNAKVVYGDTDSLFVLLPGATRDEAFRRGKEIVETVTRMNPAPVTLKFEKVYHPCFMIVKKRYVGYAWESPTQTVPKFDAKGIEFVRRDQCDATAKVQEALIRCLFDTNDLGALKRMFCRQASKLQRGDLLPTDVILRREVKLGTYSSEQTLPPGARIALEAMALDPATAPAYGERVPYVVVNTGAEQLKNMVQHPLALLHDRRPLEINAEHYLMKHIIPSMQRLFHLVKGVDFAQWYRDMPRLRRTYKVFEMSLVASRYQQAYLTAPGTTDDVGFREALRKRLQQRLEKGGASAADSEAAARGGFTSLLREADRIISERGRQPPSSTGSAVPTDATTVGRSGGDDAHYPTTPGINTSAVAATTGSGPALPRRPFSRVAGRASIFATKAKVQAATTRGAAASTANRRTIDQYYQSALCALCLERTAVTTTTTAIPPTRSHHPLPGDHDDADDKLIETAPPPMCANCLSEANIAGVLQKQWASVHRLQSQIADIEDICARCSRQAGGVTASVNRKTAGANYAAVTSCSRDTSEEILEGDAIGLHAAMGVTAGGIASHCASLDCPLPFHKVRLTQLLQQRTVLLSGLMQESHDDMRRLRAAQVALSGDHRRGNGGSGTVVPRLVPWQPVAVRNHRHPGGERAGGAPTSVIVVDAARRSSGDVVVVD